MNLYENKALRVSEMLSDKNERYQDSFDSVDKMLRILYPNGVEVENYRDIILMTSLLITLTKISGGSDRWEDVAGYGILGMKDDISTNIDG